jgi:hypothetical protein
MVVSSKDVDEEATCTLCNTSDATRNPISFHSSQIHIFRKQADIIILDSVVLE